MHCRSHIQHLRERFKTIIQLNFYWSWEQFFFLQNYGKVPTPVFREIANDRFLVEEEEKINENIKIWSKDLSHFPHIT